MKKELKNQRLKLEQLNYSRKQKINQLKQQEEFSMMESDE